LSSAAPATAAAAELRLWAAAQSVAPPDRRIEALELYLGTYPQGRFAAMAGVQIAAARQQLAGTAERGLAVQAVAPDPAAVEAAIGLSRDQRRLAQRALTVLGFDTRGADGVFGPNSRRAIAAYQAARDAEATGYLTGTQHVALIDAAAAPLAALAAQQAEQAAARDAAAAPARPALAGGRLAAVEHWLYLLDSELDGPTVSRIAASDHDMVVVDFLPSQTDAADYPMAETVARWHEAARPKLAIAYINIGEAETYRAYWRDGWRVGAPEWILGDDPDGWENNFPVAFWFDEWRAIWTAPGGLLDQIVAAGFDGVYLDWIGAYEEDNVVAFAAADGVDPRQEMVWWIGDIAEHLRAARPGMLVIAQNALGLLDDPAYLDAIDAVAQEHVWFDGGVDNEPQGGCPLPRRNSEIGSAAWRSALTRECRRAYDSDPDGTLSASSEGYLAALERARGTGMAVFTVDYAEAAADISWIDSTARGSGFLPFIGRRALDRYQPPVD
ncbi:MAG: hypothetical protein HKM95_03550, partial [Inquilinus sp.]|nr:hypothetical protein [Inquilinus sp.]